MEELVNEVFDNYYFRRNKFMLRLVGTWPLDANKNKTFRRLSITFVILLQFSTQVLGAIKYFHTSFSIFMETFLGLMYDIEILLKYWITIIKERKRQSVFERVAENWKSITDPEEVKIMKDYAKQGRLLTTSYTALLLSILVIFCAMPYFGIILDVIQPLNQTREKILIVQGEYLVDEVKYCYHINCFQIVCGVISVILTVVTDTTYAMLIQQCLAIFAIVKYRLRSCIKRQDSKKNETRKKIVEILNLHRNAIGFINTIEASYSLFFVQLLFLNSISISTIIAEGLVGTHSLMNTIRAPLLVFGLMVHLFYFTWPGQKVVDHSLELFTSIYSCDWYNSHEENKKLLQFMMLRCKKPCVITAGGLYVLNFENFGNMLRTVVSYTAVLCSVRN